MIWDFTTYAQRELYKFATCMYFIRREGDHVEVYLDEIATAAFVATERNQKLFSVGRVPLDALDPCNLTMLLLSCSVVHEWLHYEADLEEKPVQFATEQLLHALTNPYWGQEGVVKTAHMVWSHTVCPLRRGKTQSVTQAGQVVEEVA